MASLNRKWFYFLVTYPYCTYETYKYVHVHCTRKENLAPRKLLKVKPGAVPRTHARSCRSRAYIASGKYYVIMSFRHVTSIRNEAHVAKFGLVSVVVTSTWPVLTPVEEATQRIMILCPVHDIYVHVHVCTYIFWTYRLVLPSAIPGRYAIIRLSSSSPVKRGPLPLNIAYTMLIIRHTLQLLQVTYIQAFQF